MSELAASLEGARHTALGTIEDLPRSDHRLRDLRQLAADFDGDRHVLAVVHRPDGSVLATSRPAPSDQQAPGWFRRLMERAPPPPIERLPISEGGWISLTPETGADIEALWREFSRIVLIFLVVGLLGLGLVYALIDRALRPLSDLARQFVHIGGGDYGGRVPPVGAGELRPLQTAFNEMAERLAAMTDRNRHLTEQLLKLQEEERLEIARDLHDDIGPHLFAVNMDAEMIVRLADTGDDRRVVGQARAIQAAISHVQREIRDLLVRLRPTSAVELGFSAAVDELLRFWRGRRPKVVFDLSSDLEDDGPPIHLREVAYRVVQESLNNALRHARPSEVRIRLRQTAEGIVLTVEDDGVGAGADPGPPGFGLVGMAERVRSVGGVLSYGPRPAGGWRVEARLHISPAGPPDGAGEAP